MQLLLPANPLFVWLTLVLAFLLNLVPLGRMPAMPDFLAVVLVFWNVHQSRRVGIGIGLPVRPGDGRARRRRARPARAGLHAAGLLPTIHRRLLWFTVPSQAVQILPLFFAAAPGLAGGAHDRRRHVPGWDLLLAPVLEALLWPLVHGLLLAPQRDRRTPMKIDPCD